MHTVAIIGVGLIGGSFGLALKKAGFTGTIVGASSEATLRAALDRGVIDEAAPLADAARGADLIYLAQPIGRILDTLHHVDGFVNRGTLITDAGSTKSAIVSAARKHIRRGVFLGGHPMAGKEKRGVAEADADLFRGRTYVLTPHDPAALETPAPAWPTRRVLRSARSSSGATFSPPTAPPSNKRSPPTLSSWNTCGIICAR